MTPSANSKRPSLKCILAVSVMLAMCVFITQAQTASGPPKGALVLTGGDLEKHAIERFVALAGGPNANFVFIPTGASSLKLPSEFIYDPPNSDTPAANTSEFERELAKLFGVSHVTLLHTRDRKTANSSSFVEPLREANGVWLSSGNAGRFAAAYLDTLTQRELEAVLNRGGVIGGNSAGSIIQGSYTVRGRPDKPLLMARGHERGFAFLKNVAIDPHLTEQKRDAELVNVIDAHPELLGIGLDEPAAIVVTGDRLEVIGEGRVAIYDNQKHGGNWYYWLKPGDNFDLRARKQFATSMKPGVLQ
jgi:cyanophycinase